VLIRALAHGDVPAVVRACDWLFTPPSSTPSLWDAEVAAERLHELCDATRSTGFVAYDGDALVGFCTVYLDLVSIRIGQRAWVNELAVAPDRRSSGIGKQLLDAARSWAHENGATHLALDSGMARVDAHRFYRREEPSWESMSFGWLT
jgi:GNAT superfamily N-acetyltransferase